MNIHICGLVDHISQDGHIAYCTAPELQWYHKSIKASEIISNLTIYSTGGLG